MKPPAVLEAAILILAGLLVVTRAHAQAVTASATTDGSTTASATTNDTGPSGIIPFVKGPNLSLGTSNQHDSSDGWSSVLTPDFAWRFNRHFSADVTTPIYGYINVLLSGGTAAKPTYTAATKRFVAGDTSINGHYETTFPLLDYNVTVTLGLPSGPNTEGLGAGKLTYNLNNHFEKSIAIFSPDIELGIGDSSSLVDERVRKSYTSVGRLAHFQAGTSVALPFNMNFSADAYEEMPISTETIYSTTGRGKKKVTTATSRSAAEDNGFLTTLDIPVQRHVTLSGFYNRSLRNHIDTAGFSLTFFLRAPPAPGSTSATFPRMSTIMRLACHPRSESAVVFALAVVVILAKPQSPYFASALAFALPLLLSLLLPEGAPRLQPWVSMAPATKQASAPGVCSLISRRPFS